MHSSDPDDAGGQQLVIVLLIGLGLLTLGALAYVALSDDEGAQTSTPRVVVLPMREPEEPGRTGPAVEVVAHDVGVELESGCGKAPPHHRRDTMQMKGREISVYVPTKYDESTPTPLILLFHDDFQTANGFFWDTGFEPVAEEHNILLAFPRDHDQLNWRDRDDLYAGEDGLAFVRSILCVDEDRVYAVGHGSGADVVERLPCRFPLRAIATTAYRSGAKIACPEKKTPYLSVANLKDGYLPPDGQGACHGEPVVPLDAHEALWRERQGCGETRRNYFRRKSHQCWSYSCETSFVTCHLDAGRGWPLKDKDRDVDIFGCDGDPPTDFPLAEVIWRFFASHGR